jgi:hypothetical protein
MSCNRSRFILRAVMAILAIVLSSVSLKAENAPTTAEKQAAYCMEASFGFAQRLTRLLSIQRDKRGKVQTLSSEPGLSATDKEKGAAVLKSLNDEIAKTEVELASWNADLQTFMSYLKRRDRLEGASNVSNIQVTSAEVRKDQLSVSDSYTLCLRSCTQADYSCRSSCNDKANASDSNKRMLRCHDIGNDFK